MLMLILWELESVNFSPNFNTSHVNVNPKKELPNSIAFLDFNTSHVNVNHGTINFKADYNEFQYISC